MLKDLGLDLLLTEGWNSGLGTARLVVLSLSISGGWNKNGLAYLLKYLTLGTLMLEWFSIKPKVEMAQWSPLSCTTIPG